MVPVALDLRNDSAPCGAGQVGHGEADADEVEQRVGTAGAVHQRVRPSRASGDQGVEQRQAHGGALVREAAVVVVNQRESVLELPEVTGSQSPRQPTHDGLGNGLESGPRLARLHRDAPCSERRVLNLCARTEAIRGQVQARDGT